MQCQRLRVIVPCPGLRRGPIERRLSLVGTCVNEVEVVFDYEPLGLNFPVSGIA